jgi:transcriptional regulator with XRE-family HTH domain
MHLRDHLKQPKAKARFAERSGLSAAYISDLVRDRRWPSREVWQRIVEATDGQVGPSDHLNPTAR